MRNNIKNKITSIPTGLKRNIQSSKAAYLLFVLQPTIALFLSFREFRAPYAKNILWFFAAFYGITFAITKDSTSDCVRYADSLVTMHAAGWNFSRLFSLAYASDSTLFDLYQPILTLIVSKITDDYRVLFGIFGLVFGYFYSRNIWYLLDRTFGKLKIVSIILIFLISFIVGINSGINGVRFWTATHIFFYGLLRYIFEKDKKYLFIAAAASLVHFSFLLPTVLMLIYIFLGDRITIYFILYSISFFINKIDFGAVRQIVGILPSGFTERTSGYIGENAEAKVLGGEIKQVSFLIALSFKSLQFTTAAIATYIFFYSRKLIAYMRYKHLFAVSLLFLSVFNILSFIPSVSRFLSLSDLLFYALVFLFVQNSPDRRFKNLVHLASPVFILSLIVKIRFFTNSANYLLFIINPLLAPFIKSDTSIWSFIQKII